MPSPSLLRVAGLLAACLPALAAVSGCGPAPRGERVTDVDPVQATPDYWWDRPAESRAVAADFDRAMDACKSVLREKFFDVDRVDAREGVVTSLPSTNAQWFEPWRSDNTTADDVARSSVATYRRTVRFDVARSPEGTYTVTPRVLVERQSVAGRRISGVLGFQTFTAIDQSSLPAADATGTPAPATYWYAVGRDAALEARLADDVGARVK